MLNDDEALGPRATHPITPCRCRGTGGGIRHPGHRRGPARGTCQVSGCSSDTSTGWRHLTAAADRGQPPKCDAAQHEGESDTLREAERLARERDAQYDPGDRAESRSYDPDHAGGQTPQARCTMTMHDARWGDHREVREAQSGGRRERGRSPLDEECDRDKKH